MSDIDANLSADDITTFKSNLGRMCEEYNQHITKQNRDCDFQRELTLLITKYRMGEDSNLDSYALASYVMACIRAFNFTYQYTNVVEDEEQE